MNNDFEVSIENDGEKGLEEAMLITETLFSGDFSKLSISQMKQALKGAPKVTCVDGAKLIDVLVDGKICSSKREAREMITGNSITVNGTKESDLEFTLSKDQAYGNEITVIKKGKKNFVKYVIK